MKGQAIHSLIHRIDKIPRLTLAEESELLLRIKKGDLVAREKLINSRLNLVIKICQKYFPGDVLGDDLISVGFEALVRAIDSFDPNPNLKTEFGAFATTWIHRQMKAFWLKNSPHMETPTTILNMKSAINVSRKNFKKDLGRDPTIDELYEVVKNKLSKQTKGWPITFTRKYFDFLMYLEDNPRDFIDFVKCEDEIMEDQTQSVLNRVDIKTLLSKLSSKKRRVVEMHFLEEYSYAKIAKKLRITERAARERGYKAIAFLKQYINNNNLA